MVKQNLCDNCRYYFATCHPARIVFGIDIDPTCEFTKEADRVAECTEHWPRARAAKLSCEDTA